MFQDSLVNTMAADALAPSLARSSAAIVLTMQDGRVLVFHEEGFQLPVASQCWEMMENVDVFSYFLKWILPNKD